MHTLIQTQTGVFIKSICLSECLHLDAFLLRFLKFSINTMVWVAKDRFKKKRKSFYAIESRADTAEHPDGAEWE